MNREMLMLVEAISREKNVERDVVFGAVEAALAQARKQQHSGTNRSTQLNSNINKQIKYQHLGIENRRLSKHITNI